ncbi:MAG: hypothetical protein R3335_09930 [Anaerolineales bacterium]|nr:hypothetical protein [Anaerolineales bacterium]
MTRTLRWAALLALVFIIATPTVAFAQSSFCGGVVFGGSCTIETGTTHIDDLVVFGGFVEIETDASVRGDLVSFGGSVESNGTITGDVIILGGSIDLLENAVVEGDLAVMGGSVDRAPGATVLGDVITENSLPVTIDIPFPDIPRVVIPTVRTTTFGSGFNLVWEIFWGFARVIGLALIAVLVGLLAPRPTRRVARAVSDNPVPAGAYGLVTYLVALPIFLFFSIIIIVVLAITIILLPVSIIAALFMSVVLMLLVIAALFGWIALGLEVGDRLARAFDREWPAPASTGVGTLLLSLAAVFIGIIPCLGPMVVLVISSVGLGGVLLTRFGARDYGAPVEAAAPPAIPPTTGEDAAEEAPVMEETLDEIPSALGDDQAADEAPPAEDAPDNEEAQSETDEGA